jgi:hypothetical protein
MAISPLTRNGAFKKFKIGKERKKLEISFYLFFHPEY